VPLIQRATSSRRRRSPWLTVAACTVALSAFAGCGEDEADTAAAGGSTAEKSDKPVRIAVFNALNASAFYMAEVDGVKEAAEELGATVQVFDGALDSGKQVSQIQDATASQKYDAYVIVPIDGNALVPVVTEAASAGIKVVAAFNTISRDVGSNEPGAEGMVATVGTPIPENGTMIAQDIVKACGDQDPCKVAYLPGTFKQATEKARSDALKAELEKHANIDIVAEQEGGYLRAPALDASTNILRANPDINVMATSGDQMALGIEDAIKDADLEGKVKIIGNGASIEAVEAIREGRWFSSPMFLPKSEGKRAGEIAIKAFRGEDVPTSVSTPTLSPIGPNATEESLTTPEGKEFKGEWNA
jgi:ribose transport system substrate-binding protein